METSPHDLFTKINRWIYYHISKIYGPLGIPFVLPQIQSLFFTTSIDDNTKRFLIQTNFTHLSRNRKYKINNILNLFFEYMKRLETQNFSIPRGSFHKSQHRYLEVIQNFNYYITSRNFKSQASALNNPSVNQSLSNGNSQLPQIIPCLFSPYQFEGDLDAIEEEEEEAEEEEEESNDENNEVEYIQCKNKFKKQNGKINFNFIENENENTILTSKESEEEEEFVDFIEFIERIYQNPEKLNPMLELNTHYLQQPDSNSSEDFINWFNDYCNHVKSLLINASRQAKNQENKNRFVNPVVQLILFCKEMAPAPFYKKFKQLIIVQEETENKPNNEIRIKYIVEENAEEALDMTYSIMCQEILSDEIKNHEKTKSQKLKNDSNELIEKAEKENAFGSGKVAQTASSDDIALKQEQPTTVSRGVAVRQEQGTTATKINSFKPQQQQGQVANKLNSFKQQEQQQQGKVNSFEKQQQGKVNPFKQQEQQQQQVANKVNLSKQQQQGKVNPFEKRQQQQEQVAANKVNPFEKQQQQAANKVNTFKQQGQQQQQQDKVNPFEKQQQQAANKVNTFKQQGQQQQGKVNPFEKQQQQQQGQVTTNKANPFKRNQEQQQTIISRGNVFKPGQEVAATEENKNEPFETEVTVNKANPFKRNQEQGQQQGKVNPFEKQQQQQQQQQAANKVNTFKQQGQQQQGKVNPFEKQQQQQQGQVTTNKVNPFKRNQEQQQTIISRGNVFKPGQEVAATEENENEPTETEVTVNKANPFKRNQEQTSSKDYSLTQNQEQAASEANLVSPVFSFKKKEENGGSVSPTFSFKTKDDESSTPSTPNAKVPRTPQFLFKKPGSQDVENESLTKYKSMATSPIFSFKQKSTTTTENENPFLQKPGSKQQKIGIGKPSSSSSSSAAAATEENEDESAETASNVNPFLRNQKQQQGQKANKLNTFKPKSAIENDNPFLRKPGSAKQKIEIGKPSSSTPTAATEYTNLTTDDEAASNENPFLRKPGSKQQKIEIGKPSSSTSTSTAATEENEDESAETADKVEIVKPSSSTSTPAATEENEDESAETADKVEIVKPSSSASTAATEENEDESAETADKVEIVNPPPAASTSEDNNLTNNEASASESESSYSYMYSEYSDDYVDSNEHAKTEASSMPPKADITLQETTINNRIKRNSALNKIPLKSNPKASMNLKTHENSSSSSLPNEVTKPNQDSNKLTQIAPKTKFGVIINNKNNAPQTTVPGRVTFTLSENPRRKTPISLTLGKPKVPVKEEEVEDEVKDKSPFRNEFGSIEFLNKDFVKTENLNENLFKIESCKILLSSDETESIKSLENYILPMKVTLYNAFPFNFESEKREMPELIDELEVFKSSIAEYLEGIDSCIDNYDEKTGELSFFVNRFSYFPIEIPEL